MLQVELANEHPAMEKTCADVLVFREHCCSKVFKVCWIFRYSESLNQATLTVISVEGRRG